MNAPNNTIVVFPGHFNVPTLHHRLLIEKAAQQAQALCTWCWVRPEHNKDRADLFPLRHRVNMMDLLVRGMQDVQVIDGHFFRNGHGYEPSSILQQIVSRYPDHPFALLLGADRLQKLPVTEPWREVFSRYSVIVAPRLGYTAKAKDSEAARFLSDQGRLHWLETVPETDDSATKARAEIAAGREPACVDPKVLAYAQRRMGVYFSADLP